MKFWIGFKGLAVYGLSVGILLHAPSVHAAGSNTCTPSASGLSTPKPLREVVLRPVSTLPFQLPNGTRVDLSTDLNTMLGTAVTQTGIFAPTDGFSLSSDPCAQRVEIRAAVTAMQFDTMSANVRVSFGYSPAGETRLNLTQLSASAGVRVGTIAMDFSVWRCVGSRCTQIAAQSANQATVGTNLSFQVDFNLIKTASDLTWNTALGSLLAKIMNKGLTALASSTRVDLLPWSASVLTYRPESGLIYLDAGSFSLLAPNQALEIDTLERSSGQCEVYKSVAYAHTTQVDLMSSEAQVDQIFDARGVRAGDVIMVRVVPVSSAGSKK